MIAHEGSFNTYITYTAPHIKFRWECSCGSHGYWHITDEDELYRKFGDLDTTMDRLDVLAASMWRRNHIKPRKAYDDCLWL